MTDAAQSEARAPVLVVARALHPPWNEGTRVVARSVGILAARRRGVHAISLTRPEFLGETDPELPVEQVVARGAYGAFGDYRDLPAVARAVRRSLAARRYAACHIISLPLPLALVLKRSGVPVIVHATLGQHVYASRLDRARNAGARAFDRFIDAYACSSESILEELASAGHDRRRLHVLAPPLDTAHFRKRDRVDARAILGLPANAFLVVYVGTVSPARFPADTIADAIRSAAGSIADLHLEAFAPVRTHGYNVQWAHDNVERAAAATGISARVRLEDLDAERKALAYSAADVVLLPFTGPVAVEPPLTLQEAAACEANILVSPHANRSAIVGPGTGDAYDGSAADLAAALIRIARRPAEERAATGAAARSEVTRRYGAEASAAALERLWRAVGA